MIIGIDMDGVLADFVGAFCQKAQKQFGVVIQPEEISEFGMLEKLLFKRVRDSFSREDQMPFHSCSEAISMICSKGFFRSLRPLPNALFGLYDLAQVSEIIFISKVCNWSFCAEEKALWLKHQFPELDYKLMLVDSMNVKGLVRVDILVDDDPKAFEKIHPDTMPIMIDQPWNAFYSGPALRARDLKDVAQIVGVLRKVSDWRNRVDLR